MLTLLFLLAVAGIWAVFGVSLEESVEIFRGEMLEAKRWICEMLVALDSSRGEPGLGTDSDPEAGWSSSNGGSGAGGNARVLSLGRPALGGNHGSLFLGSKPPDRLLPPVPAYDATEAALMPHLYLHHADSYDDVHHGGDTEGRSHFVLNIFPRERIRRSVSPLPVTVDAPTANLDIAFEELELTQLIGAGGFGQVYRGVWRSSPVAVKVLLPVAQRDLNEESGFRSEVLMLASLRHPNVCLFMAACMAPPNRAIVTELVSRGSLWEALRRDVLPCVASASYSRGTCFRTPTGCWPWPAIMKVAEGMACGMHYLHRRDPAIIHRDLKSANLLLDDSFNVKICDFGLARLKSFTNTMTGKIGTVQWMAPEVIACSMYTETADVYSFGIVCWELLSRACPFEGLNDIQVGMAVLNDRRRPEIPEWCPRDFAALIENAWHQEASRRPSFGDILQHLRSIV